MKYAVLAFIDRSKYINKTYERKKQFTCTTLRAKQIYNKYNLRIKTGHSK